MPNDKSSGFAPVIVVLAAGLLALIPVLNLPVTSKTDNSPSVNGVLIAKGGDGGESSGGDSKSGGDSGGSSGASSSKTTSSSETPKNSGPSATSPAPSVSPVKPKIPKVEKIEKETEKPKEVEVKKTPSETEIENEIETELERPEIEKIEIKNVAGKLEVETKTATAAGLTKPGKNQVAKLSLKTGQGKNASEVEIEVENGQTKIKAKGTAALTNFPLSFDKTTGQLTVQTGNGPKVIRVLPDQAAQVAQTAGVANLIEKVELVEAPGASTSTDATAFKITGKKTGNLLGLIPVSADVETQVGAQSGTVLSTTEPLWLRLLSGLIQ